MDVKLASPFEGLKPGTVRVEVLDGMSQVHLVVSYMSRAMKKFAFHICENEGLSAARLDQLHSLL